jgi:pilus assembly protein CpaF
MFKVTITTPKGKQSIVKVSSDRCPVGKSPDNTIMLQGWTISPSHAEFILSDSGLFIQSIGDSKVGVIVNGKKIDEYGPIKPSDEIAIGSYKLSALVDNGGKKSEASKSGSLSSTQVKVAQSIASGSPEPAAKPDIPAKDDFLDKPKAPKPAPPAPVQTKQREQLFAILREAHTELLKQMDLRRVDVSSMSDEQLSKSVKALIEDILSNKKLPAGMDHERVVTDMLNEVVGLGPLEDMLADDEVTEIMVNRYDEIYVEKAGNLTKSDIIFSSDKAVLAVIERVVAPLGRRIDESSPYVDARLKDGSRFNAIIPPLALKGPSMTIRKFSKNKLTANDLVGFNSMSAEMAKVLEMSVLHRKNTVISGGTGSGKTTLLNVLSNFIPQNERIVTVEDAAELKLNQPHIVSLESRPPNIEGKGEVTIRDLVKNCLRMRPDRIVVGECRGAETLDMLQAMNTGHDGSLTTLHANTPRDAISRMEVMVLMTGMDIPIVAIREMICAAVDLIVQQTRFSCGTRKITYITEITGVESGIIQLQDIFVYNQEGFDSKGKVKGDFVASGAIPDFYMELKKRGIEVDIDIFQSKDKKEDF